MACPDCAWHLFLAIFLKIKRISDQHLARDNRVRPALHSALTTEEQIVVPFIDRIVTIPHMVPTSPSFDPSHLTRPDRSLLSYYVFVSLLAGPAFPLAFLPLFFRYTTLRYHFDEEGISMSWGILFRREIYLTYRRIQDIHLTRNILQRWMGLATISVQTASASSSPEMSIEGLLEAEQLRDYLYRQMRGMRDHPKHPTDGQPSVAAASVPKDEALTLLREIRDGLKSLVAARESRL